MSLTVPTGTPASTNWPSGSDCVVSVVPSTLSVTPAMGMLVLSSTTPLILVWAGSPAAMPEAVKVTGKPVLPAKLASTRLFEIPSCWPRIRMAEA
jgi:hypothetical protein